MDNSSSIKTVTPSGSAKLRTSSDGVTPKFGSAKAYFDGTATCYADVSTSGDFTLGTGDFTLEFWVYSPLTRSFNDLIDMRPASTNGAYIFMGLTNTGSVTFYVNSADRIISATGSVAANTWTHVAICRASGVTTMWVGGESKGTWTDTTNYLVNASYGMRIGYNAWAVASETLVGYLDEIRVTKGLARYTSNFTVPSTAFYDSFPGVNLVAGQNYTSTGPITIQDTDVNIPNGTEWVIV